MANPQTTFTIGDVTFDTTSTPTVVVSVRNLATKTNLVAKIAKGLQVSTYNPDDMKNKNNFFNFVSLWESNVLSIESHLKTFYMETPFTLYSRTLTEASQTELEFYQVTLNAFLSNSLIENGDGNSYTSTALTGDAGLVLRPVPPPSTVTIRAAGNIIREWHTMTLEQVVDSVKLQLKYVTDHVHRQNLVWTFDYFIKSIDADFKAYILSKISSLDTEVGRSGPLVFYLIAKRLLYTLENLAQKVINGFIALRLTHFEGKNVSEAIFTICNVLKFLRYGETNSFAPPTTITIIYDVFRGTSVASFCNHVQQAQDIILKNVTQPEAIFDHLQVKYEELLLADRWVPMKKKPSVIAFGEPATKSYVEAKKQKGPKTPKKNGKEMVKDSNGKNRYVYDRQGNKIDYNPPKRGQPHERKKGDRTEFWCSKCGRWGSHLTNKHDEFLEGIKNRNNRNRSRNDDSQANADSTHTRGNVTFANAVRGSLRLAVDPELTDGIDL
eukprot:scaffold803_cov127-Amphora_coffeaeformis.AAC.1